MKGIAGLESMELIIKSDEKNRAKWQLGIVDQLFKERDGVAKAVKLRKRN